VFRISCSEKEVIKDLKSEPFDDIFLDVKNSNIIIRKNNPN